MILVRVLVNLLSLFFYMYLVLLMLLYLTYVPSIEFIYNCIKFVTHFKRDIQQSRQILFIDVVQKKMFDVSYQDLFIT